MVLIIVGFVLVACIGSMAYVVHNSLVFAEKRESLIKDLTVANMRIVAASENPRDTAMTLVGALDAPQTAPRKQQPKLIGSTPARRGFDAKIKAVKHG